MKKITFLSILVPFLGAVLAAQPNAVPNSLVVTATNAAANQLLVFNTAGKLLQTVNTGGQGAASGNAGGIEASGGVVAVVNYGSKNVSMFAREGNSFQMRQLVPAADKPVSVAFGSGHLYILSTTKIESHWMFGPFVNTNPDGVVSLLVADGSAAQVGVLPGQLIITEKSATLETVNLLSDGAVSGSATLVKNIPSMPNTPFGLVTRGNNAYVTIAHSNEITLVRNGTVLTVVNSTTLSPPQMAPCWLTLVGPFLFSSNSPSFSISRYAVYGQKIVPDAAVAASLGANNAPTDIASGGGFVAVIDGGGHLSIFSVDEDGNLKLLQTASTIPTAANGVAVVPAGF